MADVLVIQGRDLHPEQMEEIRQLVDANPGLSRYQLSVLLAARWDWRAANGRLKDMAARTLMLKLERRGLIPLPPPRCRQPVRQPRPPVPALATPIEEGLASLRPLVVDAVMAGHVDRPFLEGCLEQYHYLGFRGHVGENLAYLVRDCGGRPLACSLFGAPAWKCRPRDEFIGWSPAARSARLSLLTSNTRFLILPWVRVQHLASHVLGLIARRLSADWEAAYGHPILLIESFVDRSRFAGTCYRAANWICVGATQGRGRQDRSRLWSKPIKDILVYPLASDFRARLTR